MRNILTVMLILGLIVTGQAQDYMAHLKTYRDSLNGAFADPEKSILKPEDVDDFSGLHFYQGDENWVKDFRFERIKNGKVIEIPTTTERLAPYRPYATLTFKHDGREFTLTAYQNVTYARRPNYDGSLFIPFTDLTNGNESYGGGRYMDIKISELDGGKLDFNKSYNPYCAYNPRYSCPIPPSNNHLDIEVTAGVKSWKH